MSPSGSTPIAAGHPPLASTISSRPLRSAMLCNGGNHCAACESPSRTTLIDETCGRSGKGSTCRRRRWQRNRRRTRRGGRRTTCPARAACCEAPPWWSALARARSIRGDEAGEIVTRKCRGARGGRCRVGRCRGDRGCDAALEHGRSSDGAAVEAPREGRRDRAGDEHRRAQRRTEYQASTRARCDPVESGAPGSSTSRSDAAASATAMPIATNRWPSDSGPHLASARTSAGQCHR